MKALAWFFYVASIVLACLGGSALDNSPIAFTAYMLCSVGCALLGALVEEAASKKGAK